MIVVEHNVFNIHNIIGMQIGTKRSFLYRIGIKKPDRHGSKAKKSSSWRVRERSWTYKMWTRVGR